MEYSEEEIQIDDDSLEEEYEGDIQEPFNPTKIRIAQRTSSLDNLVNRLKHGELDLSPDFQRHKDLWNESAQSRLIESLLIRIPIPAFYFDATDDSKWLVIDGVQRLTALARFVIDEQTLRERYPDLEPLKLCDLEFLMDFNGKTYDELERTYQRRINETQVTVYTIEQGTPADVKYNIFKRINTGGLPLSKQEIRNALNAGEATQLLADLAHSDTFLQIANSSVQDKRGLDQECILRFIAFTLFPSTGYREYEQLGFDKFLNDTMAHINNMPSDELNELEKTFKKAMDAAYKIFSRSAFRRTGTFRGSYHRDINIALFEVWSVNLGRLSEDDISKLIEKKEYLIDEFQDLLVDPAFNDAITKRARDISKVQTRFEKVEELINRILQTQDPWGEENLEKVIRKYPIGSTISGKVVCTSYNGHHLELEEGVQGFIDASELSWTDRKPYPRNYFSEGDDVSAVVLAIDQENRLIFLSYKATKPWELVAPAKYSTGCLVVGTIIRIANFGAFVELEKGITGLIHISELPLGPTEKVEDVVSIGQVFDLKVINLDIINHRIGLSLRAVHAK